MQPTAQQFLDAIQAHNYALVAALILVAFVYGVRKIAPKIHGSIGAFINSDRGGSLLVLVSGVLGGITTQLVAGKPLSLALIIGGIMTAAAASGGRNIVWDILWPSDKAAAPSLASTVPPPSSTPPAAVLLPFLVIGTLFSVACVSAFCRDAANKDTARCKAERVVTDCAAPEVAKAVTGIVEEVAQAFASADYTNLVATIEGRLEAQGIKDAWGVLTCAISKVQSRVGASTGSESYQRMNDWKANHPAKCK